MKKILLTVSALALAIATPAIAADTKSKTMSESAVTKTTTSATGVRASNLMNQPIVNAENETIGDINDVVVDSSGNVEQVIVGVGGFLGLGERNVGIAYDKLSVGKKADGAIKITTALTRTDLEKMPTHQE
ncbi:MAG: PRC-barrel domain-containing protein [Cyanobacteria bacterium J06648_11]